MAILAVTYVYQGSDEAMAEVRPAHREFLNSHPGLRLTGPAGPDLAAGGVADGSTIEGAVLIFEDDPAHLAEWIETDPFNEAGFIARREIREWYVVSGTWKADLGL